MTQEVKGHVVKRAYFAAVDAPGHGARFLLWTSCFGSWAKARVPSQAVWFARPARGSVVVIEFPDGMHEYVTTPVKRVLRIAGREVFYIETINSRYRLEVRGREDALAEGTG
jgi:hypothetical protein